MGSRLLFVHVKKRSFGTMAALLGRHLFPKLTDTSHFYLIIIQSHQIVPANFSILPMPDSLSTPGPEESPPRTLKEWLARDDASARFVQGDAYVASRTWQYGQDIQTVKVFGESLIGEDAQLQLESFLNKDAGVWAITRDDRKARWSQSVSLTS